MTSHYDDSNKNMATVTFYEGYLHDLWDIRTFSTFDDYNNTGIIIENNKFIMGDNLNFQISHNCQFIFRYNNGKDYELIKINRSKIEFESQFINESNVKLNKNFVCNKSVFLDEMDVTGNIQLKNAILNTASFKSVIKANNVEIQNNFHSENVLFVHGDFIANNILKIEKSKLNIQRFKGLGEMNPDELWNTTLNPETRNLLQVQYSKNSKKDQDLIQTLMGNDVSSRKDFIVENAINVSNLDI